MGQHVQNPDGSYSQQVSLMGSIPSKITIETTAVNAASVAAAGITSSIDLGATTETEIWVLVNIDQQPWTLQGGVPWFVNADYSADVFYPKRAAATTAYASSANPSVQLYLGNAPLTAVGLTTPASLTEARQYLLPPLSGVKIRVKNESAAIATVTVKIIRVWRR